MASEQSFSTKTNDVYHTDDIWNIDLLDWNEYRTNKNKNYRYFFSCYQTFLNWLDDQFLEKIKQ